MVQMRILTSNVGVGVSLSGEVADGSLEVGLSIPMGAPASGKATVNLSPVKKKIKNNKH